MMRYFILIQLFLISLFAQELKKIKDIEIDTMKYLSTDDIETRYDPTKDAKGHIKKKPFQHIEAGFSDTSGNTRTTSLNAKYTFAHKLQFVSLTAISYTIEASAFLAKDKNVRTAEEYKVLLNTKQPLPNKWLSYLSLGWLKNTFQNYDSKVDLSIGVGKILYQDKNETLIVKLGPAINYETYTSGGSDSYTSLNEYIEYRKKIYFNSIFYLKIGAKENFANMDQDYEINTLLGITFQIEKRLGLTVEYNAFYDNTPSAGFGKRDTKTVIRLGYRF